MTVCSWVNYTQLQRATNNSTHTTKRLNTEIKAKLKWANLLQKLLKAKLCWGINTQRLLVFILLDSKNWCHVFGHKSNNSNDCFAASTVAVWWVKCFSLERYVLSVISKKGHLRGDAAIWHLLYCSNIIWYISCLSFNNSLN